MTENKNSSEPDTNGNPWSSLEWVSMLWIHKAPFKFCQIQDSFVREFKCMLDGARHDHRGRCKIYLKKRVIYNEEKFTYMRLFCIEGKPFLLPCFVCDIYIFYLSISEPCRQYKECSTLFDKRRKQYFIPMPFKIAGILVKSSSNLGKIIG